MKFIKPFTGVPDGEIYPVAYNPGDVCPPELIAAATACGALAPTTDKPKPPRPAEAK